MSIFGSDYGFGRMPGGVPGGSWSDLLRRGNNPAPGLDLGAGLDLSADRGLGAIPAAPGAQQPASGFGGFVGDMVDNPLFHIGLGILANAYGTGKGGVGGGALAGLKSWREGRKAEQDAADEASMRDYRKALVAAQQAKQAEDTRQQEAIGAYGKTVPLKDQALFAADPAAYIRNISGAGNLPWWVGTDPVSGKRSIDPLYLTANQSTQVQPMIDPKTGNVIYGRGDQLIGQGVPNLTPSLQGRVAYSKEEGKLTATAEGEANKALKRNDEFNAAAQESKKLLDGGNITGSGFGAGADVLGRVIGYSSESAINSARLESLSGWLTNNVPRMEGPQSNYDIDNYKTMAAKVGDRTVPTRERQAALDTVINLQVKYRHLNEDRLGAGPPATGGDANLLNQADEILRRGR